MCVILVLSDKCKEKIVIAVSGAPGSGKTTLAKNLADALGLRYVSSGKLFRQMAADKGLSLEEFSALAEEDPNIDRYIDEVAREEALKGGVVVDGHIAAWVLEDIALLKIMVIAPLLVRAERVAKRDGKSIQDAIVDIRTREESEARRFRQFYGIEVTDMTVFDLIINTATFDESEVLSVVKHAVELIAKRLCT